MATYSMLPANRPDVKNPRTSVSFPAALYAELAQLALQKKVSVAWIIRDAAEKYVADQYPLFKTANREVRMP